MRAVVARDQKGLYHPGVRNSVVDEHDCKTEYQDFSSYKDKGEAIGAAKDMLLHTLDSHEQTRKYIDGDMPPPEANSAYGAPDIKRIAWTGPVVETDNGSLKFGAVGRTKGNAFKAGYGTISAGMFVEQGAGTREFYRWEHKQYQELGHAIFAARGAVKREVDFWHEPDRHQPEEKAAASAVIEKTAPLIAARDSSQGRFDALLSKLRMPGLKKGPPAPTKRGRPIER